MSASAVAGTAMAVSSARAIFAVGDDPSGTQATCAAGGGATVCAAAQSVNVTPTLITVTKTVSSPAATGRTRAAAVSIVGDLATAKTLANLIIDEVVPESFAFVTPPNADCSGGVITGVPPGSTCTYTPDATAATGGTIHITKASLTADFSIGYTGYIDRDDDAAAALIDATSGATTTETKAVTVDSDEISAMVVNGTVTRRSIHVGKGAAIATDTGPTGVSPGDTIAYTTTVEISDYFAFRNPELSFLTPDGTTYVDDTLAIAVHENGGTATLSEAELGASFDKTVNGDGTTRVSVDLGTAMNDFLGASSTTSTSAAPTPSATRRIVPTSTSPTT